MDAARYYGQEDIRVEDIEPDEVGPEEVRIDVEACGICGSDLHEYTAGPIFVPGEAPHPVSGVQAPLTMGHEFSGTISEVGSDVTDLSEGDAVAVNPIIYCGECPRCEAGEYHRCESLGFTGLASNGGFAENVVVDAEQAVPLGDMPVEHGALVEPLAVALHAARVADVSPGDSVAVFGSGPIGLCQIQALRVAGAGPIIVSEPRDRRRERAEACGADVLIDPTEEDALEAIRAETGEGVDIAFDVAGVEATYNQAINSTRPGGRVAEVSIFEEGVETQPNDLVIPERELVGSIAYQGGPRSAEEFGMVIDMLEDGRFDPDPLITDRIDLDDITDEGFERLIDPDSDQVKILVKP
ncbi:Threonine dehydrogenase or related Zn-dependent dehydrogenase [Halapricum desulfuricans]|uniref:Threonine dehydrogenase or related Zn-dependent dehydrogenase n=1 Tax=Halapricum desulfuricans TaxID=2841257 RepID=A0A897NIZ4_9EURY|nr:2,3-butanediol dehydrogenase [Halapricum desulfuricans]QSG12578.1 Threonine dehydrogenase or related Zn-dependent dehydrogenase [Halapricum desulfuricans]